MNPDDRKSLRDLGVRFSEHRLARKWTQADLVDRCPLHRTFIGSVERGERNLSILNLRLIEGSAHSSQRGPRGLR